MQAIAALEHLADVLVFVFDPSETCGYTMAAQENLLADVKAAFGIIPFIIVSNKSDLGKPGPGIAVSAANNTGFEALISEMTKTLASLADKY